MYSVSSSFISQMSEKHVRPVREFYIGSSDYAHDVTKWPVLKKRWDDLRPQTVTIEATNEDGAFNFLLSEPVKMRAVCQLNYGVSSETLTIFSGTADSIRYSGGGVAITLVDKFKKLSERKIGDSTTPVAYTSSAYLVHDMAWYLCTSMGGLSAVGSTNNVDLDYASWTSWSAVFSADNTRVKANFTGQNPLEALKKIGILTQSSIFIEEDRIKFARFSLVGSDSATLNDSNIIDISATIDDRNIINKAYVSADYDVTSRQFKINVYDQSSGSIADNGIREKLFAENFIWFTDSVSALNLSQRVIATNSAYRSMLSVRVPANEVIAMTIGDTLAVVDSQLGISTSMRIMGESFDMDAGLKIFDIDQTQYSNAFLLDISILDGSDVLL